MSSVPLHAHCPACGQPIAEQPPIGERLTIEKVIAAVAAWHSVEVSEILGMSTAARIVKPRQLASWLCCHLLPHRSLPEIGRALRRHHTTVIYARDKLDGQHAEGRLPAPDALWRKLSDSNQPPTARRNKGSVKCLSPIRPICCAPSSARLESAQEDIDSAKADMKEIYSEAKGAGLDTKILRKLIARRKRGEQAVREEQELIELYEGAISGQMTLPLESAA